MPVQRQMIRRTLVLLVIVVSLSLAAPWAATLAKPGGGNSANANACQKGGWATLARQESPTVAFQNQGECVSYGAQGGTLVPISTPTPTVSISFDPTNDARFCLVQVDLQGFARNAAYTVVITVDFQGPGSELQGTLTTDDTGAASGYPIGSLRTGANAQATVAGIASGYAAIQC